MEASGWLCLPGIFALPFVPQDGGATASTEMFAVERHTGVHTPVTVAKTILANQQLAYAA